MYLAHKFYNEQPRNKRTDYYYFVLILASEDCQYQTRDVLGFQYNDLFYWQPFILISYFLCISQNRSYYKKQQTNRYQ